MRDVPLVTATACRRVALVDDHALCRNGPTELLERHGGMQVVAANGDADQVLPLLPEHRPDQLVLDLRMPSIDGPGSLGIS